MPLTAGARLGSYVIEASLGAGGMGEVYRARDTRLQRIVAIKLLPTDIDRDPDAIERFHREARAIAALSHPNIVTIYAVEEIDGRALLAMELVDGSTLADLIPSEGLPLDAVLKYAIPMADALSAAHAQGITHRDLKPSNVMVTKDGRVKVLDFGLAKLKEETVQLGATVTRGLTGAGQIVGTVAYMSPEQASGGALDHRTDLFSFGVLLYEMATGVRPFKGDGSVSLLAAILKDAPNPITQRRPDLPRDVSRIVRRALAKDPEQRYQTAKDLRNDLQTLKDDLTSGELSAQPFVRTRKRSAAVPALVLVILALVTYLFVNRRGAPAPADTMRITRLTATGKASLAAVSPDGKYVVHVVSDEGHSLWVRQTATGSNVQIVSPGLDRYVGLAFSPDGNYVYFTRAENATLFSVFRLPILGGAPQPIVRDVDSVVAVSPDGSRLAFVRGAPRDGESRLYIVSSDGSGEPRQLAASPTFTGYALYSGIAWSPDGRSLVVPVGGVTPIGGVSEASLVVIDAASGKERPLTSKRWRSISGLAWLSSGAIILSANEPDRSNFQIWRVSAVDGNTRRLTNDLNNYEGVSAGASTIATVLGDFSSTLSVSGAGGVEPLQAVTRGAGRYDGQVGLTWTPDGHLVYTSVASGQLDLWLSDADGTNARALTSDPASESHPSMTPDGHTIVFAVRGENRGGLARLDLDSGRITTLTQDPDDSLPSCLPDGKTVAFTRLGSRPHLYRVGLDGGPATPINRVASSDSVSPDGRYAASFTLEIDGRFLIGIIPIDGSPPTRGFQVFNIPVMTSWMPDGAALTFLESRKGPQTLWNQPLDGTEPKMLLDLHGERVFNFAWSRDGRLAVSHGPAPTDVVLMTGIE